MGQGALPFQYGQEKGSAGVTGFSGLAAYWTWRRLQV